jgi:hypothetical protein
LQHFSLGASSDVFLANAALSAFAASGHLLQRVWDDPGMLNGNSIALNHLL